MQTSAAEFRLGSVDVGMVPLRVDERFYGVLRSSADEEFAISAPPSRMARHPDVNGDYQPATLGELGQPSLSQGEFAQPGLLLAT